MSKLLTYPVFKPLPAYTDAADVKENIDLWLDDPFKFQPKINDFLIKSDDTGSHRGYRFIRSEDLTECIYTKQFVNFVKPKNTRGIHLDVVFIRHYKCPDHMNPLYFSTSKTDVLIRHADDAFVYKSDAQLRRYVQMFNF